MLKVKSLAESGEVSAKARREAGSTPSQPSSVRPGPGTASRTYVLPGFGLQDAHCSTQSITIAVDSLKPGAVPGALATRHPHKTAQAGAVCPTPVPAGRPAGTTGFHSRPVPLKPSVRSVVSRIVQSCGGGQQGVVVVSPMLNKWPEARGVLETGTVRLGCDARAQGKRCCSMAAGG